MRYLTLLLWFALAISHAKDGPHEQIVSNAKIFVGQQLAPMLTGNDGSVYVFRNDDGTLHVLRLWPNGDQEQTVETIKGFDVPYHTRHGRSQDGRYAKYASVRTNAGIWLIGATVELLRPGKPRLSGVLIKPRIEPEVVALTDGSILVAGSQEWHATIPETFDINAPNQRTIERVRLAADGRIVSEYVAPVPSCKGETCNYESLEGFGLLDIGRSKIMLAGGYGSRNTYIFDLTTRTWRKCAPMSEERRKFSLTLLPDGRVLATGGNTSIENYSNRGMTTEIWDPKTELWSPGPKLPMPIAEHKSLLVNNKTVILAGGRFSGVLAWDIDQPQWHIAATLEHARASAGVAWLRDGRLTIIGGLHATNYDEAWGRRTEGYSLVHIATGTSRSGKANAVPVKDHASAVRGTKTLIAGGTLISSFDGSVDEAPTSNVELSDSISNTVHSLPPLPFGAISAKAFWLDDSRVLIMAIEGDAHRHPLWADLFDVKSGKHRAIRLPAEIGGSSMSGKDYFDTVKVAGFYQDRIWLNLKSHYLAPLDFSKTALLPGYYVPRAGFAARALKNGKILVAGGSGAHLIASRVANCDSCPEVFVEYGAVLPATTYEIFDPVTQKAITSAPSAALGGPVAILNDGRVAKLGSLIEIVKRVDNTDSPIEKSPLLEMSNALGTPWRSLVLPPPLRSKRDANGLRLLSFRNSNGVLDSVVLIGIPDSQRSFQWWWANLDGTVVDWQLLGPPRVHSASTSSKMSLGRLSVAGNTYTVVEDGDGLAAYPE